MEAYTEKVLMDLLRELSASNKALSQSLKTAIDLLQDNQIKHENLQPIATEVYASLQGKTNPTEAEIYWHRKLRAVLTDYVETPD